MKGNESKQFWTAVVAAILLFVLSLLAVKAKAQETITIKHTNYTTTFSTKLKYPILVEWWETRAKDQCSNQLPRKDQFAPDPQIHAQTDIVKDYVGSGYDKGHLCPAGSNECLGSKVLTECFYMSNMCAQTPALNRGLWKDLETSTRSNAITYDSIHVWAGAIGNLKTIGSHKVVVPTQCWKVIYILKTKQWYAYIFDNSFDKSSSDKVELHKVDIARIESITGFKFR